MVPHYVTTCDTLINSSGPAAAANSGDPILSQPDSEKLAATPPPQSHFPDKIDSRHAERNETKAPLLDHKAGAVGRIRDELEHVRQPGISRSGGSRKTKTERRRRQNRLVRYELQ